MARTKTIIASIALLFCGTASATLYEYNNNGGTFGGQGGAYAFDSIFGSYNSSTQDFVWQVDYAGKAAAGGWLVISDGPNPKNADDQLAILYFDKKSTNVWAYAYNGLNNNASYKTTDFLGLFAGAYSTSGSVGTISLNVGSINAALSEGVMFDTNIGIWFHPAFKVNAKTYGDGSLKKFKTKKTVWYDTSGETATEVPAPATLMLLGLGLALLGARRSR